MPLKDHLNWSAAQSICIPNVVNTLRTWRPETFPTAWGLGGGKFGRNVRGHVGPGPTICPEDALVWVGAYTM